jgi:hypothetical protein
MYFILKSGSKSVPFEEVMLECEPQNTVEHLVSLLTMRYTTLKAEELDIYHNNKKLYQDQPISKLGVTDRAEFIIRKSDSSCCQLL